MIRGKEFIKLGVCPHFQFGMAVVGDDRNPETDDCKNTILKSRHHMHRELKLPQLSPTAQSGL